MPSRERVVRAICHEEPDRVPVFEPYGVLPPTADIVLKRPCIATHSLRGARMLAEGRLRDYKKIVVRDWYELVKELKFDAGPAILVPEEDELSPEDKPRMTGEYAWEVGGSTYRYDPKTGVSLEVDSKVKRGGIPALEEEVREDEQESDSEIEGSLSRQLEIYEQMLGRLWKELGVLTYTSSGMVPLNSRLPTYLSCFHISPDVIRRYLRQRTRRTIKLAEVAADFGVELMYLGGDIAHNQGPMVSPKHYRELFLPELRAQTEALHKKGIFGFVSSDGNLWPIIEDYLVNSNADGMMEVQTTAGMDLRRLKESYGDRICFNGGVDCQHTLVYGSPELVAKETKEAIEVLSPGGGHILSSSNSIHAAVKPENFFEMLNLAREYGAYPKHV